MNCITDFICDYHSKYGLVENVNIISIDNDDCAINILSTKSLLRTSIVNVKILSKPHEKLSSIDHIDTKQTLFLSVDGYCCMVKAVKIHEDQTVEVMPTCDLLLDNEQTKRVLVDNLSICGDYENFDALKLLILPMPVEYSRYFNNITIFTPILTQTKNVLLCWNAEQLQLNAYAFDEICLKKIEFLMPVFIGQLSLLLSGKLSRTVDLLSSYLVWEYQYENEEEANYAIGPKGAHILAVRSFRGIAGVVLTKSNRLRIIAENKFALKEARSLLEIKRESYMFDDSFIPILIGKNANHITELVTKAGLHCIHVPNIPWTGVLNDHVTVNDPSTQSKRELHLFGTRESINSAKLLLEMEESVKDLKKEFELRKNNKLRQSLSLKSSTSSISKESEKLANWVENQEEVFEDAVGNVDIGKLEHLPHPHPPAPPPPPQPLSWADTQDDSGDDSKATETLTNTTTGKEGGYTDFYSSQATNARIRRQQKKTHNWNNHHSPETRNNRESNTTTTATTTQNQQQKRANRKMPKQYPTLGGGGGGLLFTNSNISTSGTMLMTTNDDKEEPYHPPHHHPQQQHQGKSVSGQHNRHRNNNPHHQNSWNSSSGGGGGGGSNNHHHNFRIPKNNDRRSYQHDNAYPMGNNNNAFSHHHHQSTL